MTPDEQELGRLWAEVLINAYRQKVAERQGAAPRTVGSPKGYDRYRVLLAVDDRDQPVASTPRLPLFASRGPCA